MINITDFKLIEHLENSLFPAYFNRCRWFAGKARPQKGFRISNALPFGESYLLMVEVSYQDGPSELYQLPIAQSKPIY
ncbi:MAG: hypothetical protein R2822_07510 [Spirosomataceae bacterium]